MPANTLAEKIRKGIKGRRGANFSHEQLIEFVKYDILKHLSIIESYEICREKIHHSSSEITGSTNAGTASHQTSGRLRPIARERGQLSIRALSAGL